MDFGRWFPARSCRKHRHPFYASLLVSLVVLMAPSRASATLSITLNNSFINDYANRATITAKVHIDTAASSPHSDQSDGDEHAAGTSDAIGFATVVEIMNAKNKPSSGVTDLEQAAGRDVSLTGFWRLWPEHGGSDDNFTQGGDVAPITNTNPPHVFEIHPILSIDGNQLQTSIDTIDGYSPKDAADAFAAYERTSCTVTPGFNTTTITTEMIGYNYVEYRMLLTDQSKIQQLTDGGIEFFAQVEDAGGDSGQADLIANKVRMIAAPGTAIFSKVEAMHSGDSLVVWGVPRIDLSIVRYRASHPETQNWSLPYEMILVGYTP